MAQIRLWVKPDSGADALEWDPWRKRWAVSCRAPPVGGKANIAVTELMADWLGVPRAAVRWTRAGSSRSKVLSVEGMTDTEAERRLRSRL